MEPLHPFPCAFIGVAGPIMSTLLHWVCGLWTAPGQAHAAPQFPWLLPDLGQLTLSVPRFLISKPEVDVAEVITVLPCLAAVLKR